MASLNACSNAMSKTFSGGLSRVSSAMPSSTETRRPRPVIRTWWEGARCEVGPLDPIQRALWPPRKGARQLGQQNERARDAPGSDAIQGLLRPIGGHRLGVHAQGVLRRVPEQRRDVGARD